jgi:hypothetical protein
MDGMNKTRPACRRWRWLLPAAVATALIGCTGDYGFKGDPFLGGQAANAPQLQYTPGTSGSPSAQTAAGQVPPLPATHSLTSAAALAGGTTPTPEIPRDLRISGGVPIVPASMPGGGTARGAAPGGVLEAPQPVPESTSNLPSVAPTDPQFQRTAASSPAIAASSTSPTAALTFEQAQQILKQYGVTWQRLETVGDQGQWKFRCSIPNPANRSVNRWYETTRPLPYDPLTAVRAVIDQLQKEQR